HQNEAGQPRAAEGEADEAQRRPPAQDEAGGEGGRQREQGEEAGQDEQRQQPDADVAAGAVGARVVGSGAYCCWQTALFFMSRWRSFSFCVASFFHSVFGYRLSSSWKYT